MTAKEFIKQITNSKKDFIKDFFDILKSRKSKACIIGGLAVNVYAEPVVSLDADIVVIAEKLIELNKILKKKFKVKTYEHSINILADYSDIRIQIQTDERYQPFIKNARIKNLLGYKLPVAAVTDVLQGKIWAYTDRTRRASKRQKDLADIMRLIEAKPNLISLLPKRLKKQIKK